MANDIKVAISLEGADALKTIKALEKGITKLGDKGTKSVNSMTDAMSVFKGVVGAQVLLKGIQLVGQALETSAKEAIEFGTAVAEINSIAPRTAAATLALKQQLIGLSNEFAGPAQKQAKAFYNIVSAGVEGTAKQLNVLAIANKAAVAGLVDIDTSARVLVSSVNSYASSGLTASDASDVLFNTVREGITTFGELAGSIGTVAPIASAAGLKFSELGGTLAFLTKSGISTSEAATGLRAILTGVIKPSQEAAASAKALGIDFSTTGIKAKGFAGFMKDVIAKTGGTETALAKLFPNVRALGPVIQIAKGNFEDFATILDKTSNSSGATQKAFSVITNSAGFQVNKLVNQLKNFPTAILTNFEEPLTDALKAINEFVGTRGVLLIADAVDAVLGAFDDMQSGISNIKVALAAVASGATELAIKWTGMVLAINEAASSVKKFLRLNVSASHLAEAQALKDRIKGLKDFQKAQEEGAIAEIKSSEKTSNTIAKFKEKLAAGRAEEEATIDERRKQSVEKDKAVATKILENALTAESDKFNAIQELKNAQAELDAEKAEEAALEKLIAEEEEFASLEASLGREAALKELSRIQDIDSEKKRLAELKKLKLKAQKSDMEANIFNIKTEKKFGKAKVAAQKQVISDIATLQSSGNGALFALGKAAALTQAGINVAQGVTNAIANVPYPLNIAAAISVGAAGAVQLAAIAGAKKPSAGSFQAGGIVNGASQTGDQLTANVNGGEAIFNRRQQENLFRAVDSGSIGGGGGNTNNISIESPTGNIPQETIDNLIDQLNDRTEFGNKTLGVA
mgnify:CR=1 FL=1